MATGYAAGYDERSVATTEMISIRALDDLDEITRWLGTFRARLAAAREAQRGDVADAVGELEARFKRRRAELA